MDVSGLVVEFDLCYERKGSSINSKPKVLPVERAGYKILSCQQKQFEPERYFKSKEAQRAAQDNSGAYVQYS